MSVGWLDAVVLPLAYLLSAVLFIFGLKGMTRIRTARRGNLIAGVGMLLAIVATLLDIGLVNYRWILIGLAVGAAAGAVGAYRVAMTAMPEFVALFNGCGGGASTLVALGLTWQQVILPEGSGTLAAQVGGQVASTTSLSILIGGVTFSGSMVAFAKLAGWMPGQPQLLPARHLWNALLFLAALVLGGFLAFSIAGPSNLATAAWILTGIALLLGVLLVIPIGGADMPVVISLLNSYSGMAACTTGFVLKNNMLIIAGALVGASGLILTRVMCHAMNRSLPAVVFGGFGMEEGSGGETGEYENVRSCGPEETALLLENASTVAIAPGYGLAVAQAQHAVHELARELEARGAKVYFAIHPVAGRMPGHMNVLLAEADVPYEQLVEMEAANPEFPHTDVVLVVGANDVVNPAAQRTPGSPIYGMPVLRVWEAGSVIVNKRSLASGFAGIKNELFEGENTLMLFGDAKEVCQQVVAELKELG